MHAWEIEEAKKNLSMLIDDALHAPQIIARNGKMKLLLCA